MDGLLVCLPDSADGVAVRTYAGHLHELLGGQISYLPIGSEVDVARLEQASRDCGLIIYGEPKQSCLKRLLTGHPGCRAITRLQTSLLVTRQPRWPIKNILLILRIEETDKSAVDWVGRLSQSSGTAVTILPIVPWLPAMFSLGNRVQPGMNVLLTPNTPSGQRLGQIGLQLAHWQVECDMHFRQGKPDHQIREEVSKGNYDLIIIGSEPCSRVHRLLLSGLVSPLLRWVNRPLLIAQTVRPAQSTVGDKGHD